LLPHVFIREPAGVTSRTISQTEIFQRTNAYIIYAIRDFKGKIYPYRYMEIIFVPVPLPVKWWGVLKNP